MRPAHAPLFGRDLGSSRRASKSRLTGDGAALLHGTWDTLPPKKLVPVPMVVTIGEVAECLGPDELADPYRQHVQENLPRVLADADAVIAPSEWMKETLCAHYGAVAGKVTVIPPGVPDELLVEPAPGTGEGTRKGFTRGKTFFYAHGSHRERKNVLALVRAAAVLKRKGELGTRSCSPGRRQGLRIVDADLARGPGRDVFIHSAPRGDEMKRLYAEAVLTVLPSTIEAWPAAVVESLAVGTPAAVSRTIALPPGAAAFVETFDPTSPEEMAAAIARGFARAAGFAEQRAAARALGRAFSWRVGQRTMEVYRRLSADTRLRRERPDARDPVGIRLLPTSPRHPVRAVRRHFVFVAARLPDAKVSDWARRAARRRELLRPRAAGWRPAGDPHRSRQAASARHRGRQRAEEPRTEPVRRTARGARGRTSTCRDTAAASAWSAGASRAPRARPRSPSRAADRGQR